MTSMAVNQNELTSYDKETLSDKYGYGLHIYLTAEQCEALGIKDPIKPGSIVTFKADAFVCSSSQSIDTDGDDAGVDVSMDWQIIDISISRIGQVKSYSEVMYGNEEKQD